MLAVPSIHIWLPCDRCTSHSLVYVAGLCYQWLKNDEGSSDVLRTGELILLKVHTYILHAWFSLLALFRQWTFYLAHCTVTLIVLGQLFGGDWRRYRSINSPAFYWFLPLNRQDELIKEPKMKPKVRSSNFVSIIIDSVFYFSAALLPPSYWLPNGM